MPSFKSLETLFAKKFKADCKLSQQYPVRSAICTVRAIENFTASAQVFVENHLNAMS